MLVSRRAELGMPLRFGAVGAVGFLVNIGVYAMLVHNAGLAPHAAAAAAFAVAVSHNYVVNRAWTFRKHRAGFVEQGTRFLVVSVLALIINLAVLALLLAADVAAVPAEAGAIGAAAPVAFLANRFWSFRPRGGEHVAA